jgi:hypothetical protein
VSRAQDTSTKNHPEHVGKLTENDLLAMAEEE